MPVENTATGLSKTMRKMIDVMNYGRFIRKNEVKTAISQKIMQMRIDRIITIAHIMGDPVIEIFGGI